MLSQTGREAGLPACSSGLRVTGGAWAAFFASKKSQYKGEAVTQWARDRAGRLPRAFISDSNAAFGAALENLGLEKIVTHEAGNHSEGFRNPEDTTQIPWSGSEGAFTEWYETSPFRGFKTWENTHRYFEVFNVYYNLIRPHSSLTLEGKPTTPAGAAGFKHMEC